MSGVSLDMLGVGNALLDVEYRVTDAFLEEYEIEKRRMTLVDESRMLQLIDAIDAEAVVSTCGGSVANTMYAMRGFGNRTHLICRVAPDVAGKHFISQLNDAGIGSNGILPTENRVTGRCLVLVTEDAERTMNTCLGVSEQLLPSQVQEDVLVNSKAIYIEGYLASSDTGSLAAERARQLADENRIETNITLADTSMVHAFRPALETMIGGGLTRVFCNQDEALAWCRTDRLDIALQELVDMAKEVVVTLGPRGCVIRNKHGQFECPAVEIHEVDLNGAGDMFAAAYLSMSDSINGESTQRAARFANYAASELIKVSGARLSRIDSYGSIKHAFETNPQREFA